MLPAPRDILARLGGETRKSLGQHFLLDTNITDKMVRLAGIRPGETVLEIGPGPGGLTRSLLLAGAQVTAVEKDRRCVEALRPLIEAADGALRLIEGDALRLSLPELAREAGGTLRIVANLPYNISTQLVYGWLESLEHLRGLVLMFQKEVADRIVAAPGSKAYGKLSVLCDACCTREALFTVPPSAFVPPPKVYSTVVALTPKPERPAGKALAMLWEVAAMAFNQRRKMLRSSLKGLTGMHDIEAMLHELGIDPARRAETLTMEEFRRVSEAYAQRTSRSPDTP